MAAPRDPFADAAFRADPHAVYARLRRERPVAWLPHADGGAPGACAVTRYGDVRALLCDERLSAERDRSPAVRAHVAALPEEQRPDPERRSMLTIDPPAHTRLRRLVLHAFTPRRVEALAPRIEALARALLDEAAREGRMDAISALAEPLPAVVIAELLGVPPRDHPRFRRWSRDLLGPLVVEDDAAARRRSAEARRSLDAYLLEILEARRREPRDDLVSALLEARDEDEALSGPELMATCHLLLVAGHETTTNLIGNTLATLLRHPEALERVRADPDALLPAAVEESLRFESPLQGVARVATRELEVAGERVPPGTVVSLMLGAANRDSEVFDRPERFDVGREPNPHLAFGFGTHFCLGAALARLEGRIALGAVLERFPWLAFDAEPAWRPSFLLRGLSELRVACKEG